MTDSFFELQEFPVLWVKADLAGKGPAAAFDLLESRLPTLKGRRFYGSFRVTPSGEEYRACVARIATDDPVKLQLEVGTIPGGWYVRRKVQNWDSKISELPRHFEELARGRDVDPDRPSLEFYRSRTELYLLVPIRKVPDVSHPRPTAKSDDYDSRSSIMDDEGRAHPD